MENDRFDQLAKAMSGFASRRFIVRGTTLGVIGTAFGLAGRLASSDGDARGNKRRRKKKVICHCATNDPNSCSTIKVKKKARKQHLKHYCDYPGACQPGVVGQCTPPEQGCTRDSQCPAATPFCQNRICVECRNNNGCPAGERCQDGTCVAGCTRNSDCPAATPICLDQVCVACTRNSDCCSPQICGADNHCEIACGAGSCDPDSEKCCTPTTGSPVCIPYDQCCTKLDGVTALNQCLPSTNQANKNTGGARPYVEKVSGTDSTVTLRFVRGSTVAVQFFEFRIDGDRLTCGTPHQVVIGDWQYPGVCLGNGTNCPVGPIERTFDATEKVEVRLALGAENDWYFEDTASGWITFPVGA